jgi:inosine-uridine nucleoside N-ribohydrolase
MVPLIIDTDLSFDSDDVAALCIAHALMDNGEAEILAVLHSVGIPQGAGMLSVINRWYGRDGLPIGAYKGKFGERRKVHGGMNEYEYVSGRFVPQMVAQFPSSIKNWDEVPGAVEVYRAALAGAEDHSVVIAAIGFLTNLAALLRSSADEHSSLSGRELVAAKVKRVVYQGGWYPPNHPAGEWHATVRLQTV